MAPWRSREASDAWVVAGSQLNSVTGPGGSFPDGVRRAPEHNQSVSVLVFLGGPIGDVEFFDEFRDL